MTKPVCRVACVLAAVLAALVPAGASAQRLPVREVVFHAPSVDRTMKYSVILPEGYEAPESRDRAYPVLYLLHGAGSNHLAWSRFLGVPSYALSYQMIVVMPDAGNTYYVNWARSEDGERNLWEDYVIKDVIGHVDANFRTIPERAGRAITGYSMGGYGALTLGLRHPDLFVSVGSHSGSLEYARSAGQRLRQGEPAQAPRASSPEREARRGLVNPLIGDTGFSSLDERTPHGQPFLTPLEADAHDPFSLLLAIPRDELPHIHLDCGTEDRLIAGTQEFARLLLQHNIPFDYLQLPGAHDAEYSIQAVGYFMALQHEVMMRALGQRPMAVRRPPPQ